MDKSTEAIYHMARMVTEQQNCVLEVVMRDGVILAHLIPIDLWDDDDYEEEIDD